MKLFQNPTLVSTLAIHSHSESPLFNTFATKDFFSYLTQTVRRKIQNTLNASIFGSKSQKPVCLLIYSYLKDQYKADIAKILNFKSANEAI